MPTLAVAVCLMNSGCASLRPYAGQWVMKSDGRNLLVLRTNVKHRSLVGEITTPIHFEEDAAGVFHGVSKPIQTFVITGEREANGVRLAVEENGEREVVHARLADKNLLFLARFRGVVPDFRLVKVASPNRVEVSDDWPNYNSDPKVVSIRDTLRRYAARDQAARENASISDTEVKALSDECSDFLRSVYDAYGWPKTSVFGFLAVQDFSLLVRHQPPAFQEMLLIPLKAAVDAGETPFYEYADMSDRVQIAKGRPQHWGTQATCVHGKAVLDPVDEISNLGQVRKAAGLADIAYSLQQSDAICARVPH